MIAPVDGKPQRDLRQEGADLRFDGLAVGGGEEVVRRIDCLALDFQYAVCVGGFCLADQLLAGINFEVLSGFAPTFFTAIRGFGCGGGRTQHLK